MVFHCQLMLDREQQTLELLFTTADTKTCQEAGSQDDDDDDDDMLNSFSYIPSLNISKFIQMKTLWFYSKEVRWSNLVIR